MAKEEARAAAAVPGIGNITTRDTSVECPENRRPYDEVQGQDRAHIAGVPHVRGAKPLAFHPASNIFPLMPDADPAGFAALVEDIKQNGLREPVMLHPDRSILDGRNRYLACLAADRTPHFVNWGGRPGDELRYVISKNLHRRHLDTSQRAMVAARIAAFAHGGDRQAANLPVGPTQAEAARALNISERSMRDAAKVISEAPPEIIKVVEDGKMAVSAAANKIRDRTAKSEPAAADAHAAEDQHPNGDTEEHHHGEDGDGEEGLTENPLAELVSRLKDLKGPELAIELDLQDRVAEARIQYKGLHDLLRFERTLQGCFHASIKTRDLPRLTPEIASAYAASLDKKIAKLRRLRKAVLDASQGGRR
jgi:hypothetical protein